MLFAIEGEISEHLAHALSKAADLDKSRPDGIPESDQDQQDDKDVIG